MSNQSTVLANLQRYGQPCTVKWPARGTGSLALAAETIDSLIRISQRQFGELAGAITGLMPPTDRNLQGATIQVGTRTYTVTNSIEKVDGGDVYMQTVVLA